MGKTAFFIRHAKSSWSNPGLPDIKRPLNPRGLRDAPRMAAMLREREGKIDGIVSSPAVRAYTTATFFAREFGILPEAIRQEKELYHAFPETILEVVQELEEDWDRILVFGHNPGFTALANDFSDSYIDNVPTCGIVEVYAPVAEWVDFGGENAILKNFYYPKQFPV